MSAFFSQIRRTQPNQTNRVGSFMLHVYVRVCVYAVRTSERAREILFHDGCMHAYVYVYINCDLNTSCFLSV